MLYEIPLHLSMLFSSMAHGAFWKYLKIQQTGQKEPLQAQWKKGAVLERPDWPGVMV